MQTEFSDTLEIEMGVSGMLVGVEFDFDYTPGEPMVMYDADGSGYPGSPPEGEITEVRIVEVRGVAGTLRSYHESYHVDGADIEPRWKALLYQRVWAYVYKNEQTIIDDALEGLTWDDR